MTEDTYSRAQDFLAKQKKASDYWAELWGLLPGEAIAKLKARIAELEAEVSRLRGRSF